MFDPVDSLFTPLAELADEAGLGRDVDLLEFGLAAGLVTEAESAAVESWIAGPKAGDMFDGYDPCDDGYQDHNDGGPEYDDRDPHCHTV